MSDLLVKLYDLPELSPVLEKQKNAGVIIRRPLAPEKHIIISWVQKHFSQEWATRRKIFLKG